MLTNEPYCKVLPIFYTPVSVSHIVLEEFWTTLLYDMASVDWGLWAFVHAQLPLQHFSLVEPWILTGPVQHLDYFLFQPFCWRFANVLCIIVLLQNSFGQALAVWQMASHLTLEYSGMSSWLTQWLQGAQVLWLQIKQQKIINPPISVMDSWYDVVHLVIV